MPSTGHYLYLQCPTVTKYPEWHPFTISSAPDEAILEVNIRVLASPLSWTNKVAKYLQLLDPTAQGEIELVTRNPTTGATTLGKVIGPNNKPFFRVDAPHGAPSQHVFVYNTALIVGAGIGVTPCASIMKGIVNYRWKKGFKPKNLYFFWVARLTDLTLFKWLVVMLPELKAKELLHNEFYDSDQQAQTGVQARMKELKAELKGLGEESQRTPSAPPPLPENWIETHDQSTGQLYYYNRATQETRWQRPTNANAPQRVRRTPPRFGPRFPALRRSPGPPAAPLVTPDLRARPRSPARCPCRLHRSDVPRPRHPSQVSSQDELAAKQAELQELQDRLRAASVNKRKLDITLYLTGAKAEQLKPKPAHEIEKDSIDEMIAVLQDTKDANGKPFVKLKAGRPKWEEEFKDIGHEHGREDVGVCFCGAPMIAAALKETCEKLSNKDATVFRLHKENF